MGFSHFLQDLRLADGRTEGVNHDVELFEDGHRTFLRIWITGIGSDMPLVMRLDAQQAVQLQQGLQQIAAGFKPN